MKNNNEAQNFGVKLTNELMTDIIGAIIPGALFIVCLVISVITPVLVIFRKIDLLNFSELPDSMPWVLLLLCLILSYVFGLIFYRADIKVPDKEDIERQIIETIVSKYGKDELELIDDFHETARVLQQHCKEAIMDCKSSDSIYQVLKSLEEACGNVCAGNISDDNPEDSTDNVLKILFPEDCIRDSNGKLSLNLSRFSKDVLNYYKELFLDASKIYKRYCRPNPRLIYELLDPQKIKDYDDGQEMAEKLQEDCEDARLGDYEDVQILEHVTQKKIRTLMYNCILNTQCELGCCSKKRGEFPYMNFYKYLLKRNIKECVKHVDWCSRDTRTKNHLNAYKINIQTFASEAYALLNKNESHIRMSSASWHVSYRIIVISYCMVIVVLLLLLTVKLSWEWNAVNGNSASLVSLLLLLLFPFSTLFLSTLIKRRIAKFIHYQRLREISYTLFVYNEYEPIIKNRKALLASRYYYTEAAGGSSSINVNAKIKNI